MECSSSADQNMDNSSFESLVDAYQSAPSAALAKVIVLELVSRGDASATLSYLPEVGDAIANAELKIVGEALVDAGHYAAAIELLNHSAPAYPLITVRALYHNGQQAEARVIPIRTGKQRFSY